MHYADLSIFYGIVLRYRLAVKCVTHRRVYLPTMTQYLMKYIIYCILENPVGVLKVLADMVCIIG